MSERARLVILIVGSIALFAGVALVAGSATAFDYTRDHASHRTNPWGTKAWRELIERSGVPTETWSESLDGLSDEVEMLVLLDPVEAIGAGERAALSEWVSEGGRLIVAPFARRPHTTLDGPEAAASLEAMLATLGVRPTADGAAGAEARPTGAGPLTAEVELVVVPTEGRLATEPGGAQEDGPPLPQAVLSDEGGNAVAIAVARGAGQVVVLAEAEMLANATLARADNVVFAMNLVFAEGAPAQVHFAEYHHGVVGADGVFVGPEVDVTPFRNTTLALLAIALIYAIGRGRRFGSAVPEVGGGGRAAADYVRALAQLHSRAGAASTASGMLAAGLTRRAAAAAGLPSTASTASVSGALESRGLPGDEIGRLIERLEGADESMTDAELLTLARQVAHYERML